MDDPPGELLEQPMIYSGVAIGFFLLLTAFAASLAAARTALYFAGLVNKDDVVWSGVDQPTRDRAERWLRDARLLSVAIQFYHTVARALAVVSLLALSILANTSTFWSVLIPSAIVLILSEACSRLFARKHPVRALFNLHRLLVLVYKTMMPVSRMLDTINVRWNAAFGARRTAEQALAQVIQLAAAASENSNEKDVVKGIANFGGLRVVDLMKGRHKICAMSTALNFDEVMEFVNHCGYSRIPVYKDSIDHIQGVLYIKDLLPFFGQGRDFAWANVIRPGYFVWSNKRVDALLKDFQEKRVHIAIVRDDAGNTAGLVTLEDLIELVIREINEQRDGIEDTGFVRIDERTYVFNGKASIREVFKLLDADHPMLREPAEYESLEDFIVEINDELPSVGDEVNYDQFTFVVEAVEFKRIKRVRVNVHAQA